MPTLRALLAPASQLLPRLHGLLPALPPAGPDRKRAQTWFPAPGLPMTTEALLLRWPSASLRTELVHRYYHSLATSTAETPPLHSGPTQASPAGLS